jgi:hypothetical protein
MPGGIQAKVVGARLWRAAQVAGVVATAVLMIGLVWRPQLALHVLWDMTIPLLPATFAVSPMLWRNVCPLATIGSVTGSRVGTRTLPAEASRIASIAGLALLALLVPARRFLFDANGVALATTIGMVALIAVAAGLAFTRRAGFCNAICPVLPVEKLYGQAPLLDVASARCANCSLCTPVGCLDLAQRKTLAQTVGPSRKTIAWPLTPYGAFAAAFPGFIVGYFTLADGPLGSSAHVYAHVAAYALASWGVVVATVRAFRIVAATALPVLGALSLLAYYWLAAPTLASAYGATPIGAAFVRAVAVALVALCFHRGARMTSRTSRRLPLA